MEDDDQREGRHAIEFPEDIQAREGVSLVEDQDERVLDGRFQGVEQLIEWRVPVDGDRPRVLEDGLVDEPDRALPGIDAGVVNARLRLEFVKEVARKGSLPYTTRSGDHCVVGRFTVDGWRQRARQLPTLLMAMEEVLRQCLVGEDTPICDHT